MNPERTYYNNGQLKREKWCVNGKLHRLDGPAYRKWGENGRCHIEEWRVNEKLHRLDGPAYLKWNEDEQLVYEEWRLKGGYYEPKNHPFNIFKKEYNLPNRYDKWPEDIQVLFEVTYK